MPPPKKKTYKAGTVVFHGSLFSAHNHSKTLICSSDCDLNNLEYTLKKKTSTAGLLQNELNDFVGLHVYSPAHP